MNWLKRIKWRRLFRNGCLAIVGISLLVCGVTGGLALAIVDYSNQDHAQPSDTIIVLGAGSRRVIIRRATHAYILWEQGMAENIICTGGATPGGWRAESETCRETLLVHGVPASAIHTEQASRSTEENALEAETIMHEQGWTSAIIVSDNYHMWRAKLIFDDIFGDHQWQVYTSPAQQTQPSISARGFRWAVFREVGATYWHVGKTLLGLPYTDFPPS